jgi:hypothetical protein
MRYLMALTAFAIVVTPALAQNTAGTPTFGTLTLSGDFAPDPTNIIVSTGGTIDASKRGRRCSGFIPNAPHVRINYKPGRLPLIISADSSADTSLVINLPNGRWLCDDDSGNGVFNPSITLSNPQAGQYEIWVGGYGTTGTNRATLSISQRTSY